LEYIEEEEEEEEVESEELEREDFFPFLDFFLDDREEPTKLNNLSY